jgi:acetyl-CoA acyltransferase
MREAVIVSAVRTAVGRAPRGSLRNTRPDDLAEAMNRVPGLKPEEVEDMVIGCSFPEAEQGLNVARLINYLVGLPYTVPGQTVNRFCASGLQAIVSGAEHIMCGFADVIIGGGVECMSMVPMGGNKTVPNLRLIETYPEGYTAMWPANSTSAGRNRMPSPSKAIRKRRRRSRPAGSRMKSCP